jgi:1L-myo-inositol 1-phosphate cytidylyltransferase / CDP-L-myo-inositol myo-inositolphosphotransferase
VTTPVSTVFFTSGSAHGHATLVGGVSALERRVREFAKRGCTKAIAAMSPVEFPRPLPIPVEFVAPDSAAPDGTIHERADVIAGIEIVDDATRRAAEWKLIRGSNKSFEGPVDALINWRFSMRITRFLSHRGLGVTPNQVTICAIVLGLTAAYIAAFGSVWLVRHGYSVAMAKYLPFAIAGVMLEINSILDSVDGELARLRFQYSKVGQWLDNLSDDIVDNVFIVATGYGLSQWSSIWWLYAACAAAGARVTVSLITYFDVYHRTGTGDVFAFRWWFESDKATADDVYDPTSPITWLRSFGRRDTFVFVWMVACVASLPYWVVVHGVVIGGVQVGLLLCHFTIGAKRR